VSGAAPGPAFVRRTGTGLLAGGQRLTWTVAEGRRGRRWRATTLSEDGRLLLALLLEIDPSGCFAHLEASSPAGMLTLHPEAGQATLHGNVVRASGLEHVTLPWSPRHILMLGASPVTAVVAAAQLAGRLGMGEGMSVPAVDIGETLAPRSATWRAARLAAASWRLLAADGAYSLAIALDDDGAPAGLASAQTWPMELIPGA